MLNSIILTGGGTGGHIMPNLALIPKLKQYFKHIHYIGNGQMDKKIVLEQFPFVLFHTVQCVKFDRKNYLKNILIPFKLSKSVKDAKIIIRDINPSVIFSKGGYVSLPTMLASKNYPLIIHESDQSIGLANRLALKNCNKLLTAFESVSKKYKGTYVGNPIDDKIFNGNKNNIDKNINLDPKLPTILVICGSQGSKIINKEIQNIIPQLCNDFNIIHFMGKNNTNEYTQTNYFQIPFALNIQDYYAASDIVISRGGANTLFELIALKKPTLAIPLPKSKSSRGDQVLNVEYFANKKYIMELNQKKIYLLKNKIYELYENKDQYIKNCATNDTLNGTNKIIKTILETASTFNK